MRKRRSKHRVIEIDKFLGENYPVHGAEYCSEILEEPIDYIKIRVQNKKIIRTTRTGEDLIEYVRSLNKSLRKENMLLISDNRRLRGV